MPHDATCHLLIRLADGYTGDEALTLDYQEHSGLGTTTVSVNKVVCDLLEPHVSPKRFKSVLWAFALKKHAFYRFQNSKLDHKGCEAYEALARDLTLNYHEVIDGMVSAGLVESNNGMHLTKEGENYAVPVLGRLMFSRQKFEELLSRLDD